MFIHAFKNIFRNARRSTMILIILALSMVFMFLTYSYLEATYWALRTGAQSSVGELEIGSKKYWNGTNGAAAAMSAESLDAVTSRLQKSREIKSYDVELDFEGLIGNQQQSTLANGVGVTPGARNGSAGNLRVVEGHPLFRGKANTGIIGTELARELKVGIGDWLSVMTQTVTGAYNAASFQVVGIVSTGSAQADKYYVAVPLAFARTILETGGASRVLVFYKRQPSDSGLAGHAQAWRSFFRSNALDLDVRTWKQLSAFYFQLKSLYDTIFGFMVVVIVLLVSLSVFEIISMAFFERTREIGTLRAIGNTKGEILALLSLEVFLLYLVGMIVGGSLGLALGAIINSLNIRWLPPGSSLPVPLLFFLNVRYTLLPAAILLVASMLAGGAPSIRTSRLNVAEVLRYE